MRGIIKGLLALSTVVLAATTSTDYVSENFSDEQVQTTVKTKINSTYSVTIPKLITITDKDSATYIVKVKGDIAGYEWISVEPDKEFELNQPGKPEIEATVSQAITIFRTSDYIGTETDGRIGEDTTGIVTATNLSAGTWSGAFKFNVEAGEEHVWMIDPDDKTQHVCSNCGIKEEHTWQQNAEDNTKYECSTCGIEDYHVWVVNSEDDTTHICEICYIIEDHTVKDNKCTICNKEIECEDYILTYSNYNIAGISREGDIVIPEYFTYNGKYYKTVAIGVNAFEYCTTLTSVTIPDSVTFIGGSAFYNCTSLTSVTIPSSVASIKNGTFQGCSSLKSIMIPSSVTSIESNAFMYCSSLTSITIPNSVTLIADHAFQGCTSLTSITIPDSVTLIEDYAFQGCTSLTSITIPDSVTLIRNYAFESCTSLTSVTIPDSVETIGGCAFQYCYSLASVTISDGVTSIGGSAFHDCYSLASVTIPDSVTHIGTEAFRDCTSLKTIYIPSSVTTISTVMSPFYGCDSSLKIYCGASGKQSGWGICWDYYDSSKKLSVTYGVTREEYESTYKQ